MEAGNNVSMSENPTNGTQNDITDPLPAPTEPSAVQSSTTEHLSTIQSGVPAATTPTPAPAPRTSSIPPAQPVVVRPDKPALHGGPTRQYLNQRITPHLLEGMKYLAMHEPEKPLAWLADFLKDRSKQIEG